MDYSTSPRPLVLTTGVFDLLHPQHVELLEFARSLGIYLLVGINSDQSVQRLKGSGRPVMAAEERKAMLQALRCVTKVTIFPEDTPLELIHRVRPTVYVKGHDYGPGGAPIVGKEEIEAWGGRVVIAPTTASISTSQIIDRILKAHTAEATKNMRTAP